MGSVIPFLREHAFSAETTRIIGEAFDKTLVELHDANPPDEVSEIIARRILDEAARGERDPERLCAAALVSLGVVRRQAS